MPLAIIRPPNLSGGDPDYTLQIHNALLELDQKQQALSTALRSLQTAPAPTPAPPAPVPAPVLLQKFTLTGPPTPTTAWTVTHNLGTKDIVVSVRMISTGQLIMADTRIIDDNKVGIFGPVGIPANVLAITVIG